jgi:ribosomal protein S18 acetylase RimI-like enzyme
MILDIRPARSPEDIATAARLFRAYADGLGVDLCFQGFDAELAGLPGAYAPPGGELLLARDATGQAVGCVALRATDKAGCAEMKRLYVAPEARGGRLDQGLAEAILEAARSRGYAEVRLDTLPEMTAAIALYRQLGFQPIAPYYDTPVAGTLFLARRL